MQRSLRFLWGGHGTTKLTVGLTYLESWAAMDGLPIGKTCRAVKLLNVRSFELKSRVHEVLDQVWKDLVNVDIDNNLIRIQEHGDGKPSPRRIGFPAPGMG